MTRRSPIRPAMAPLRQRYVKRHRGWRPACRSYEERRSLVPRGDERGSVELVVATPLLLLMILMVIQFAMYEHASQVAQATAAQALAATRTLGGTSHGQHRAWRAR